MSTRYRIFVVVFLLLAAGSVSAQTYELVSEKRITPVKGKKLLISGTVKDGDEVVYRLKARAGQALSIKLFGRDADFNFSLNHGLDLETFARDTKSWSGKMPSEFDGECEIAVHSNYKLARYRLEILLK